MIGSLNGTLIHKNAPQVVLEVGGVGYEVDLPLHDFATLPAIGEKLRLHTHLVVREDAHLLYGFFLLDSRNYFRLLLKVSGIGPRTALAILSSLSIEQISIAIEHKDIATLSKVPGIGKKTAERLALELQGSSLHRPVSMTSALATGINSANSIANDVENALLGLGYHAKEVAKVLPKISEGPHKEDLSAALKQALQLLMKN